MAAKRSKRKASAKPRTPRAPARPSDPLTPEQAARYTFMRTATPPTDQKRIADALIAQGVDITRQSVGLVIRNKFANEAVFAEFCKQTGKTREEAWPDVPARVDETKSDTIEPETAERVDVP